MRPGDHLYLAFGSDEEQREIVCDFITDGLALDEKVVFVGDRSTADTVAGWLDGHSRAAGTAGAADTVGGRGFLQVRPAESAYLTEGHFDPDSVLTALRTEVAAAQREAFSGLRLAVEMSWALRGAPGSGRLPEYERRLEEVFHDGSVTGLCLYDRRLFDGGVLGHMTRLHPTAVEANALHDDRMLRITRTFDPVGLSVAGAVDTTTVPALAAVLNKRAAAAGHEDIRLDVAGLEFIDVAGLRAIVETAGRLQGRVLRMTNLAPALRRVVSLVGWDQSPGLEFDDEAVLA